MSHRHSKAQGAALTQRKQDKRKGVRRPTAPITPSIRQRVLARIEALRAANAQLVAQAAIEAQLQEVANNGDSGQADD